MVASNVAMLVVNDDVCGGVVVLFIVVVGVVICCDIVLMHGISSQRIISLQCVYCYVWYCWRLY